MVQWGQCEAQLEAKNGIELTQKYLKCEKMKNKPNQIYKQDQYFGCMPRQYIKLGVSVHMGNFGVL